MGILSGIVSYLFGLCLNLLDAAIGGFLGALGFDLDTFETYFPAAKEYYEVIIGFAIGLLFIMLIFQIFRNFGIILDMEVEDPLKMLGKTALFFGMIISSRSIINLILNLLTDPYSIFLNTATDPYEFELLTLATSMFTSVFSNPFFSIVALVLILVLGWQFLKLTVECVERYIVFYFVLYCAPVVFATGAFKSTAQIFKSWCRMLASQAMLLLLNIWSIKLFLSFMPVFERSSNDLVFNFLMGYAFLKFAQKADTLLRILGLNTASTGDMVRSLGGTIAGIAMAIKTTGSIARGVSSAAGRIFGGGNSSMNNTSSGGTSGNGESDVGGMSGSNSKNSGVDSADGNTLGGVTNSGINSAKRSYVDNVMNAARGQMSGGVDSFPLHPPAGGDFSASEESGSPTMGMDGENQADGNISMQGEKAQGGGNIRGIDAETTEGLSNLAHGLPHDKYDPIKKTFSGGGFPEFTGEDANIIGASQMPPADGVSPSVMKMADGTTGAVYRNAETGDASVVQFASVDNGVMQGTISKIDSSTGKIGEDFSFKAVHSSVPGAESFSAHSVPISDGEDGTYHVVTGADTSFFSVGTLGSSMGSSPASGGINTVTSIPKDGSQSVSSSAFSQSASPISEYSSQPVSSMTGNAKSESAVSAPISASPFAPPMKGQRIVQSDNARSNSAFDMESNAAAMPQSENSIRNETILPSNTKTDEQPIQSGMKQPRNEIRRFSKDNPENVEIFRRGSESVEIFDKPQLNHEDSARVPPPHKIQ